MNGNIVKDNNSFFFVGIGGVSMSALALLLFRDGKKVCGSDVNRNGCCERLEKLGVCISYGHKRENIPQNTDVLIYTSAVTSDNPEIVEAVSRGINVIERKTLLQAVACDYKNVICVSGSHGKTTVTAMLGCIFEEAGRDPTVLLGGSYSGFGGNVRPGSNGLLIAEVCEYKRNFLSLHGDVSVVLNVDFDHPDYYRDISDVRNAFGDFVCGTARNGCCVLNADDGGSVGLLPTAIAEKKGIRALSFGVRNNADIRAVIQGLGDCADGKVGVSENHGAEFDLYVRGEKICRVSLTQIGVHSVYNALAAISAAYALGVDAITSARALGRFRGVSRRSEVIGRTDFDAVIISDYAHHPRELSALFGCLSTSKSRVLCVFQPHTYSRTLALMDEFAEALSAFSGVVLLPVYSARESYVDLVPEKLLERLRRRKTSSRYVGDRENVNSAIKSFSEEIPFDAVVFAGAGDIDKIALAFAYAYGVTSASRNASKEASARKNKADGDKKAIMFEFLR